MNWKELLEINGEDSGEREAERREKLMKIKANDEYLIQELKNRYAAYEEFLQIKTLLTAANYRIEEKPGQLKIYKEI